MKTVQEEYAQALFQIALEMKKIDTVEVAYSTFIKAFDTSVRKFFLHPKVSRQEKKDVLTSSVADDLLRHFLFVLIDNERMDIVGNCYYAFNEMIDRMQSVKRATVFSRDKLSDAKLTSIGKELEKKYNQKIEITAKIDPEILSGFRIEIDGFVIDATANRKLADLKNSLKQG
ncbi:MAG: ATP synthase F1 subunit delta [Bacilli bacterium]|nr:ATP synthase F1 subunit delta [Bacilli bacterium]MBN2696674.1 ATP synthase F1 subunit delta [Bacilli bacterium]